MSIDNRRWADGVRIQQTLENVGLREETVRSHLKFFKKTTVSMAIWRNFFLTPRRRGAKKIQKWLLLTILKKRSPNFPSAFSASRVVYLN
jgi:hypothetical protein